MASCMVSTAEINAKVTPISVNTLLVIVYLQQDRTSTDTTTPMCTPFMMLQNIHFWDWICLYLLQQVLAFCMWVLDLEKISFRVHLTMTYCGVRCCKLKLSLAFCIWWVNVEQCNICPEDCSTHSATISAIGRWCATPAE